MQTKIAQGLSEVLKDPEVIAKAQQTALGLAEFALAGASMAVFQGLVDSWKAKSVSMKVQSDIKAIAENLRTGSMFQGKDREKAVARFYEIARVAPHVAPNQNLIMGLIKSRLHTGLTEEDRQRLALLQAQYSKDPNVNQFIPKMASDKLGSLLAEATILIDSGMEKEADAKPTGIGRSLKVFGALSLLPVVSGLIGGGVNMAVNKIKGKKISEELNSSYLQAMKMSSSSEGLQDNPDKARRAFNTLANFAPQVALDPQAARAFMSKIVSYDQGIDMSTIKELSEISKNLSQASQPHPFNTGYVTGSNAVGGKALLERAGAGLGLSINDNLNNTEG